MKKLIKKVLNESLIDTLNISKKDKGILKYMNLIKNDKVFLGSNEFDMSDSEMIGKVAEMFNTDDYQELYILYKFFKKNYDLLFGEYDLTNSKESTIDFDTDHDIIESLLYRFFYKHYNRVSIYEDDNGNFWEIEGILTPQEADLEESFGVAIFNHSPTNPPCVLYFSLLPNKSNKKIGVDFLTQDDEFAEFNAETILRNGSYEEMLDSKWLNIGYPSDIKPTTLTKYFDMIINKLIEELIKPNEWKMKKFLEINK
jgi:hypothetical protein